MVSATLLDTLTDIGAIGGTLAIIGVGLLILLVAAQAREIRSMREWIDAEPERQQETTQRVIAEVQRRIAAARERRQAAKAGVPTPQAPSIPPPAPRAPAPGTLGATPEAQALAAAKEGSPEGEADVPATTPPRFAPLAPAAAAVPGVPMPGDDPGRGDDEEEAAGDLAEPDDEVPAVVAEFASQDTVAADAVPGQEEDELAVPPFAASSRAASRDADTQYSEDRFGFDEEPRSRSGRILVGGGLLALLVGIVLLGSQLFGGGGEEPTRQADDNPAGQTDGADGGGATDTPAEPERIDPATINVQVLNGTQITGLAQRVTDRIKTQGYGTGQPETASDGQTIAAESTVAYREGHKQAAEQVAEELGLSGSAVRAMSPETAAAIGETFEVVVTAGRDLDRSAPAGTSG